MQPVSETVGGLTRRLKLHEDEQVIYSLITMSSSLIIAIPDIVAGPSRLISIKCYVDFIKAITMKTKKAYNDV